MNKLRDWIRAVSYLAQKEFRQTLRDGASVRIILVVPVVQLIVLSYAMTTDLKHLRVAVYDGDKTYQSRRLIESFFQNEAFDFAAACASPAELSDALQKGGADLTAWIPKGYAESIAAGKTADIGLAIDGRNSSAAGRAMGYAESIVRQEALRYLDEQKLARPQLDLHMIKAETRFFYNPELISQFYMVPAILVVLVTTIGGMLTGMAVVREKEIGTLEQLMVTPLTPGQIIAGKMIPFAILAFLEFTIACTIAVFWFHVPLEGSLLLLAGSALIYLLVALGGGLLASTVSETQQQAMLTVWFFLMFGIMTSGVFYPIENMPRWVYLLTYLNPLRFFMAITRGIFLKGSGFSDILPDLIPLIMMAAVVFTIAVKRFHKRLA